MRSRRCRHAQGLSCVKTRIFSFVFHFICSLNVLLLSNSPNYWAAKWKCVQTKALISLDCALCRFQCMLTWCEKGSKLFTETCFLLKSRQSYTTGTESSALSKYWDDFCAKRFGDINYSGLIFITWRCDYHGFNGISVYCVMFDRSPPRAGHWLFCSFDGQYPPILFPQLQDNLTLGQQGVLEDVQVDIRVNFQG